MKNDIVRLGLNLMAFTVIAGALLAVADSITAPIIAAQQQEAELAALLEALPVASTFVDGAEYLEGIEEGYPAVESIYVGLDEQGEQVGLLAKLSFKGYGGPIELMAGINQNGKIAGLKVLSHQETPGLGENITSESFVSQFVDKSTAAPLRTVKSTATDEHDIVAITAATISSEAVVDGLNQFMQLFNAVWGK
ncbi:MAG: RnfABCDGE type electron transport complex subunit G [Firmicutes bacterium]|nr:RnfABCDGE type electron transport complex subunit G [Bacillota bacterium]